MPQTYDFTRPNFNFPPPGGQPASNRQWATGKTAWDPQNIYSAPNQISTGWGQQVPGQTPIAFNPNTPSTGWATETPAAHPVQNGAGPVGYMGGAAPSFGINPMTGQPMTAPAIDYTKQAIEWTQQPPAPTWNPPATQPGLAPEAFNTQYGTLENLQPYMNPYLDQIIERGNNAIQSSAAARGLLGSSATLNNIGDWTAQAQQRAYSDARDAFNYDRTYMTDVFRDNRNNGQDQSWKINSWNYGIFGDEKTDYDQRMKDWYNQTNGITQTGINATNNTGDLYAALGQALAGLYGEQGNVQAGGIMGGSAANRGLIGNILGMFFGGG